MKKTFLWTGVFLMLMLILSISLFAQETSELPKPVSGELPEVMVVILGAISAFVVEFVQKQKNPMISLGIAILVSALIGGLSTIFIKDFDYANTPVLIAQIWAYASATWAALFKAAGLSKKLKTSV